jgi:hypothetical protein
MKNIAMPTTSVWAGGGASFTSSASAENAMNKGDSAAIKRIMGDSCMGKLLRE